MKDYLVRGIAKDGQIRAFALTTKELTEEVRQRHNLSPIATAALGRLMSSALMMSTDLKGEEELLTLQIKSDGPMRGLLTTVNGKGEIKGYVDEPSVILPPSALGKLDVGRAIGNGILTVIKDLGMKEPYSSQVRLQTGEIGDDISYYYLTSEQIPTALGVGVLMNKDNTVAFSGGFMIQLMPFADEAIIPMIEENIAKAGSVTSMLKEGKTPEAILETVLKGLDLKLTEEREVGFKCHCSEGKIHQMLVGLGKEELTNLIEEEEVVEVNCHFCNTKYKIDKDNLIKIRDGLK